MTISTPLIVQEFVVGATLEDTFVLPASFLTFEPTVLSVQVNGSPVTYVLSGRIQNQSGYWAGGTITLSIPVQNSTVRVVADHVPHRLTDFPDADIDPDSLNGEFDYVMAATNQLDQLALQRPAPDKNWDADATAIDNLGNGLTPGSALNQQQITNQINDVVLNGTILPQLGGVIDLVNDPTYSAAAGSDISSVLQAAIDALTAVNGGTIYIEPNATSYFIDAGNIEIKANVTVWLANGAVLEIRNDVDGLIISENGAQLRGGRTLVTKVGYTKSAVKFHPRDNRFSRAHTHGLFDHQIASTNFNPNQSGVGLHLLAEAWVPGEDSYCEWVHINNVAIEYFDQAIRFEAIGNVGELAFCNGNFLNDIAINRCIRNFVYRVSGDDTVYVSCGGHVINNVQIEADGGTTKIIDSNVAPPPTSQSFIGRIMYRNMSVFDYSGTTAFDCGSNARHSQHDIEMTGLSPDKYSVDTLYTKVRSYWQPYSSAFEEVREWVFSSIEPSLVPDKNKNSNVHASDFNRLFYCDGTYWHGFHGKKIVIFMDYDVSNSYEFSHGELSRGRMYWGDTDADASIRELKLEAAADVGSVLHYQRRNANAVTWINPGPTRRIYDPFTGRGGVQGERLALNTQYDEVILECIENVNWVVRSKKGTGIDFAGASIAPVVNDPSGGATVDAEARTAINAILNALDKMKIVDNP